MAGTFLRPPALTEREPLAAALHGLSGMVSRSKMDQLKSAIAL